MKKSEQERLKKQYLTEVDAALAKRTYAYRLLTDADFDLAMAKRKLRDLLKEDKDVVNEKE